MCSACSGNVEDGPDIGICIECGTMHDGGSGEATVCHVCEAVVCHTCRRGHLLKCRAKDDCLTQR